MIEGSENWEVGPCFDPTGRHMTSWDIWVKPEPDAIGVAVIASVYSGEIVAREILAAIQATRPTTVVAGERQSVGASVPDQALAVPVEPVSRLDPTGFDPSRKHHHLLAVGEIPCRSCPNDFPYPARYIASAKRTDNLPPVDWPVCEMHSQHAMIAGWFPLRTPEEWRAAIATEARRAETENTGSVHEGAGPQDIAQ